jgi:hypothetical protein
MEGFEIYDTFDSAQDMFIIYYLWFFLFITQKIAAAHSTEFILSTAERAQGRCFGPGNDGFRGFAQNIDLKKQSQFDGS